MIELYEADLSNGDTLDPVTRITITVNTKQGERAYHYSPKEIENIRVRKIATIEPPKPAAVCGECGGKAPDYTTAFTCYVCGFTLNGTGKAKPEGETI